MLMISMNKENVIIVPKWVGSIDVETFDELTRNYNIQIYKISDFGTYVKIPIQGMLVEDPQKTAIDFMKLGFEPPLEPEVFVENMLYNDDFRDYMDWALMESNKKYFKQSVDLYLKHEFLGPKMKKYIKKSLWKKAKKIRKTERKTQ